MKRPIILVTISALFAASTLLVAADDPPASQSTAICTCREFRMKGTGWCSSCGKGLIYTARTKSRRLYDTMMGTPLDAKKVAACKLCKKAAQKDGVCKKCHVGYLKDHVYASLPAHAMALGGPLTDKQYKCKECQSILREGHGAYCAKCKGGILNGLFYKGRPNFDRAWKANQVMHLAIDKAPQCEDCAIAMLLDGECAHCKIKYKSGQPVAE